MKLLIVSVVLIVVQTSFCVDNEMEDVLDDNWNGKESEERYVVPYVIDYGWEVPFLHQKDYAKKYLDDFKTAVADKNDKSIKHWISILFTRLYKGQWVNDRRIRWNKQGSLKIKNRIKKNLKNWFYRLRFRIALNDFNNWELYSYHFDCAYEWLEMRIKTLQDAKQKESETQEQNENTSSNTKTDWLTHFETLKTKVDAARNEVEKLNEARKGLKKIKKLLKNKKEISKNTAEIKKFAREIVASDKNSKLAKLTSDVIDYLKEISGYSQSNVSEYESDDDDDYELYAVIA